MNTDNTTGPVSPTPRRLETIGVSRDFSEPDQVIELDHLRSEIIEVAGIPVAHTVHARGWRWKDHVANVVGTPWCETRHVGVAVAGALQVLMADGGEDIIEAGQAFVIPLRHDGWVVGDGPFETYEWAGALSWIPPVERLDARTLSLVLTDIAGSTAMANSVGSLTWSELIAIHHERSRDVIATHLGRVEKFTGDGVLASFNGAAAALSCALALGRMAESLEMTLRVAVHTGEVSSAAGELAGIAIHELARIIGVTKPGQILVSDATRLLARTGAFEFADHGTHDLRGIEGSRTLFVLVR